MLNLRQHMRAIFLPSGRLNAVTRWWRCWWCWWRICSQLERNVSAIHTWHKCLDNSSALRNAQRAASIRLIRWRHRGHVRRVSHPKLIVVCRCAILVVAHVEITAAATSANRIACCRAAFHIGCVLLLRAICPSLLEGHLLFQYHCIDCLYSRSSCGASHHP